MLTNVYPNGIHEKGLKGLKNVGLYYWPICGGKYGSREKKDYLKVRKPKLKELQSVSYLALLKT